MTMTTIARRGASRASLALALLLLLPFGAAAEPPDYILKAAEAYSKGDLNGAVAHLETLLKTDPTHEGALMNLGLIHAQTGQWKGAISCFERIIKQSPKHFAATFNLGKALLAAGKSKAGLKTLRRATTLAEPGDPSAHVELAAGQLGTGDTRGAEKTLRALKPIPLSARMLLAFMAFRSGAYDKALVEARLAHAAAEAEPGSPVMRTALVLAQAELHSGDAKAAKTRLQALIRTAPKTQANIPYALGLVALAGGDFEGALRWWKEATGRAPAAFQPPIDPMAFPTPTDRAYLAWATATSGETMPSFRFDTITASGGPGCEPAVVAAAVFSAGDALSRCENRTVTGQLTATGFTLTGNDTCQRAALASVAGHPELAPGKPRPKKSVPCTVSLTVQRF